MPYVAADDGVVAYRYASQYCRVGVNYYVVLKYRVAGYVHRKSAFVERETFRAERHALVQPNAVAYDTCFAYDHTRAVVYAEVFAYLRSGVYVYSCGRMGQFGDYPRYDRYAEQKQFVRYAVVYHGNDCRITEYHLAVAACRRVAVENGFHVSVQQAFYLRQAVYEFQCVLLGRLGHWAVGRAEKAYAVAYLFFEQFVQFFQVDAGEVLACLAIGPARAEKSGEHDRFDMPDDFLQVPYVGQAFTFLGNVFFLAGRGVRQFVYIVEYGLYRVFHFKNIGILYRYS